MFKKNLINKKMSLGFFEKLCQARAAKFADFLDLNS